jgi:endoglucanase
MKSLYYKMKNKIFLITLLLGTLISWGQGLKTEGKIIVNSKGEEVILRGMGLGGWMLMEGYMMQSSEVADTQHEFRSRLVDLIGESKTDEFFNTWLANHVTKKDIDSLAKWGFNSVRLPMHYNLFTLPIEDESVIGQNTWLDKGFTIVDNLLDWCEANSMYLILDLHGAPGGQGTNAAISDYDDTKPSLWQSQENKNKTVALWRKLAERYKDEPWIGGYDLINEVNGNHVTSPQLKQFYIEITNAIREVDTNHILFIEGHDWANNFTGLTPVWDDNMVYSFHKYWSKNDNGSIQWVLDLREQQNVPLWMGEAGENSNVWFTEAITLFEENKIGWSWWPMKRVETIVGPYSIKFTDGYKNILEYWKGNASKPSVNDAFAAIMELANNTNSANCDYQKDVPDAMIRQVATDTTIPYSNHTIPGIIYMSDFDLGKNGYAYFDKDYANYAQSTGSFQAWNDGWVYRNDAIDIQKSGDNVNNNGYHIGYVKKDEWMNYTVTINETGKYKADIRLAAQSNGGEFHLAIDGEEVTSTQFVNATGGWETFDTFEINNILLEQGIHVLTFRFDSEGEFNLSSIEFTKTGEISTADFNALNGHTVTNNSLELIVNQVLLESSLNNSKDLFNLVINGNEESIASISYNSNKNRSIVINTDKTLVYTDEIKVSYNGSVISSESGKLLSAFTDIKIRNTLESLFILPGKIEVEDYMEMEGLGVENTTDQGGGKNIGYTDGGDFADYIIYSEINASYKVDFRFAGFDVGEIGLYLVDENGTENELLKINTPKTNGWQTWQTVSGNLNIPAGINRLRLKILTGGFNMNWMLFEQLAVKNDLDDDGVLNENDDCPNTPKDTTVDANGCIIFTLPVNNFGIKVLGESCPGKEDGRIIITTVKTNNYQLNLNGIKRSFTSGISLSPFKPGVYTLCFTVEGEEYEQCFSLEVLKGFEFNAKSIVSGKKAIIEIQEGTAPYMVFLNGFKVFETMSKSFEIDIKQSDLLEVKSAKSCEGTYKKRLVLFEEFFAYPNPTSGQFEIAIPNSNKPTIIEVYNMFGQLILENSVRINSTKTQINLSGKPNGVYFIKINAEETKTLKILKE